MIDTYPELHKSYKKKFPFKLCTTSFIYPANYIQNITMLGPYVDEIELLFFESHPENGLPVEKEMSELAEKLAEFNLSCNIHLPLDISLGDSDSQKRRHAIQTIKRLLPITNPLFPTTYTVHFTYEENEKTSKDIANWQKRVIDSMGEILGDGIPASLFTVENLNYPFEWTEDIIDRLQLRVCIDIGHFITRGESFEAAFEKHRSITDIFHICGVSGKKDHLSLEILAENHRYPLLRMLKNFSGIVSLEVFSFQHLESSLVALEKMMA